MRGTSCCSSENCSKKGLVKSKSSDSMVKSFLQFLQFLVSGFIICVSKMSFDNLCQGASLTIFFMLYFVYNILHRLFFYIPIQYDNKPLYLFHNKNKYIDMI